MKKDPSKPVRAAGILLVSSFDGPLQFLLMRHPDRWDLPKGHCERGESFLATALRETHEETGIPEHAIAIDDEFRFDLVYPVRYRKSGNLEFEKHVRYFLGRLTSKPELALTEHESASWFDWNPPHSIQAQTIDPLLAELERHWAPDRLH